MDIVFPNDENPFEDFREKLGFKQFLYVYPRLEEAVKAKETYTNVGVLVAGSKKDILSRSQKAKAKGLIVLCPAQGYDNDKFVLEKTPVDIMFDFELLYENDHLHYRRSGLNQVLCKSAAENGKIIAFSLRSLLHSSQPALLLGRMIQNAKFCRKYNVKTVVASFARHVYELRGKNDIEALRRVINKSS
jgi:RNase P/RNase MRP subunit p30